MTLFGLDIPYLLYLLSPGAIILVFAVPIIFATVVHWIVGDKT